MRLPRPSKRRRRRRRGTSEGPDRADPADARQKSEEQAFDFAEKLLAQQRELAESLLAAATPAFPQPQGETRVTDEE